jgi:hypothetical protein
VNSLEQRILSHVKRNASTSKTPCIILLIILKILSFSLLMIIIGKRNTSLTFVLQRFIDLPKSYHRYKHQRFLLVTEKSIFKIFFTALKRRNPVYYGKTESTLICQCRQHNIIKIEFFIFSIEKAKR